MVVLQCHSQIPIFLTSSSSFPRQDCPFFCPKISSISKHCLKARNKAALVRRSDDRDRIEPVQESSFFDENGVVEDMDSYLNYLSLEYDSVWDTKPSWCQPWTIGVTGVGVILGSWLVLNSAVVTSVVAAVICLWWYLFLYSYPKAYSDMITERRKKVTSGVEDTYGMKTER